jgi:hypothetical protein
MHNIVVRSCPFLKLHRSPRPSARIGGLFGLVVLSALIAPAELRAQPAARKAATEAAPAELTPLGRYVPKDNLIFYMEHEGLSAHAASWEKTAAYKMLNGTPLGVMLEEVCGQLLDKAMTFVPNHRLSGPEIVSLFKGASKSGWVLALNLNPKGPDHVRGTFVQRGAVGKALKPISSKLMGWMMGTNPKYKIDKKDGRTIVVLSAGSAATGPAAVLNAGWAWWAENDDLVVNFMSPAGVDAVIAALDGKTAASIDHPVINELKKPEGTFQPVCVAFAETANCPEAPNKLVELLRSLKAEHGLDRIDLRWGFDDEALMSVSRLVAPKPRKTSLAFLDQPTFKKDSLLPMPDSVESFVELSINTNTLVESLEHLGPPGTVKGKVDELAEMIKKSGQIDLRKDVLSHLGPRMVAYLAAGRSAATNDDSLEAALKNGLSATAAVTAMQTLFPKLTLVAEVKNPEAFGKALDTVVIAINHEIKAQAIQKAAEDKAAADAAEPGGTARTPGGRGAGGGDATKRRREPSYPRFNPIPGQTKSFVLMTPSDSALRFGPSSFRPTILLEDKYVAFGVSSDSVRAALTAVRRKDWKPSASLEKACEHVPPNLVLLSVTDVSESLSSMLASLPGTLQTMINTSIALAKARASGTGTGTNAAPGNGRQPGGPAGMPAGGPTSGGSGSMRAMMRPGGPGGASRPGFGPQANSGSSSPGGTAGDAASGTTTENMIVLKVDPDKLPSAADLKAHLFPTTLSVTVSDPEIRVVTRGAFPDLSLPLGMVSAGSMMPFLKPLIDGQPQAQAAGASGTQAGPPATTPAAGAPAGGAGSLKGRMRGGRGRGGPE